jgi:DNA polymerase I-like protein with 3'-5' exonuclease and polymerase domains
LVQASSTRPKSLAVRRYTLHRKTWIAEESETLERVQVLAKMEAYGVKVDVDALQSMSDDLGMQVKLGRCTVQTHLKWHWPKII